jgi:serine protease Do
VVLGVVVSKALDHWPTPVIADGQDGKKIANEQALMFRNASKKIGPSVVAITRKQRVRRAEGGGLAFDRNGWPFYKQPKIREDLETTGVGSGFIFDSTNGYILTNNHVVTNGDAWVVRLGDKREHEAEAKLIGTDPQTDVAVLKIDPVSLTAATLGNSDDLEVGDWVLAVGNPFGLLEHTVTAGIISAKGRQHLGLSNYEDFLQTDAAINPGNSGGPLVNLNGDVVGINTAIFSMTQGYQGIGFAIPINQARRIAEKLIAGGAVTRGWMGVVCEDLRPADAKRWDLTEGVGAMVDKVAVGGPAHRATILPGDVLTEVNGKPVHSSNDIRDAVADMDPGSKVPVVVRRKDDHKKVIDTLKLDVIVGKQPKDWNSGQKDQE